MPPPSTLWALLLCGCASMRPVGVTVAEVPPEEGLPLIVPAPARRDASAPEAEPEPEPIANVGCIGPPSPTALKRPQRAVCCYSSPEVFRRQVMRRREAFRACYDAGLARRPGLRGRVAARFTIEEDGSVARVCDAGSNLPDPETVGCVLRAFTTVAFDAYGVDDPCPPVTLVYPLAFEPRPD